MNHEIQLWRVLSATLLFGLAGPLSGQISEAEGNDSVAMVSAINAGNYATALEILHRYGIAESTLELMAARLGQTPRRVALAEPFLRGYLYMGDLGEGHKLYRRVRDAAAINHPLPLWVADNLNMREWRARCDRELGRTLAAPIGVLNPRGPEQAIRFFQWFDRYAENLHSVGLNWYRVNNFDATDHAGAYRLLNALFQLVKARKPDAFAWLLVERTVDNSDLRWLEAMRFPYDGLLVGNLRDFTSAFESTRKRYLPLVGESTPMVLTGFYGYEQALVKAAEMKRGRRARLLAAGQVVAPQLDRQAQHVWALGYRGLVVDWRVVEAVAAARGVATK
jgi:hypothetical protein